MVIRKAHFEDIGSLVEIENDSFSTAWNRANFIARLETHDHVFLVSEMENGEISGYMSLQFVLDEGYIINVATHSKYRRQGIADELIREMEAEAIELNLAFMTLEVRETNTPAINLYKKHGFSEVGLRKNYYDKPKENAILMTKFLSEVEN